MVFRIFTLFTLFCTQAIASEDWQVMPQICVAEHDGNLCKMTLTITHNAMVSEATLCAFVDTAQLVCWQGNSAPIRQVSLRHDSWLFIKDLQGNIVHSQKLLVKWEQNAQRRRVRDPWSLF